MKLEPRKTALALGASLFLMTPALASAERIYFLVGTRHVYRIGPDRDANLTQREEIEKTYADGVAQDQNTFQDHLSKGANKDEESKELNQDLDRLADERDKSLGAIFELRDDIRQRHPELHIEGDGPYQVMGIDFHMHANVEVFDNFVVYAPWPGYVCIGAPYGGWAYGVVYTPGVFFNLYLGWHANVWGGERFYGGFYGHAGRVDFHPVGFHDYGRGFAHGGYGGYGRAGGYAHFGTYVGGYSHSYGRSASYSRPANPGGFGHGAYNGGYSHGAEKPGYSGAYSPHSSSAFGHAGSFGHSYSGANRDRSASAGSHPSSSGHGGSSSRTGSGQKGH